MVRKAEVTTNTTYKEYFGTSGGGGGGGVKSGYSIHTQSFRHISYINNIELSKYFWTLKTNGTDYHLKRNTKWYTS